MLKNTYLFYLFIQLNSSTTVCSNNVITEYTGTQSFGKNTFISEKALILNADIVILNTLECYPRFW